MANTKEYRIVINGITESLNAVNALNESLKTLESRINALSNKAVNVSASSGGGGSKSSSTSSLSEEEKLERQIAQLEEKRIAHSKQIYQNYLAAKDVLKETENDQKQIAATERLAASAYTNTISGMKQELADIKQAMQTVDLGDTDQMKKMVDRANELNNKLKEIEQSYGQFGRNVGNYASAAEGFDKIKVAVGDTVREYDNYRQAIKELKQERFELSQSIGTEAEAYKKVDVAIRELESNYKDLDASSAAMDKMLDTMESMVAIASVGKGISAFFGFDNSQIEQSIQKLVALQNMLTGIEKIRKQMLSGDFFGGIFSKANKELDGLNKTMKTTQKEQKGVAAGNTTIATSAKAATVASKALSASLKAIGVGVALAALAYVVDGIQKIAESLLGTSEAAKKAKESLAEIEGAGAKAYVDATEAIKNLTDKVNSYNSAIQTEAEFIKELQTQEYSILGSYKTIAEYKQAIIDKSADYIRIAQEEALVDAQLALAKDEYIEEMKKIKNGDYHHWYRTTLQDEQADFALYTQAIHAWQTALDKATEAKIRFMNEKVELGLPQTSGTTNSGTTTSLKSSGAKTVKTVKEIEEEIAKARVSAMKQGFSKTILELQLERDRRIEEAKKTGKLVAEQIAQINADYNQKIFDAKLKLHKEMIEEERRYADELLKIQQETQERQFDISSSLNQQRRNQTIQEFPYKAASPNRTETFIDAFTYDYNQIVDNSKFRKAISEYKELEDELDTIKYVLKELGDNQERLINGKNLREWKEQYINVLLEMSKLEKQYKEIDVIASHVIGKSDSDALGTRLAARQTYYTVVLEAEKKFSKEELEIEKKRLDAELDEQEKAEKKRNALIASRIYSDNSEIGETPRKLLKNFQDAEISGDFIGKEKEDVAKILEKDKVVFDEWLNSLEEKLQSGELKWNDYIEIVDSSLIQSYIKAKTDYEQFLGEYNKMSEDKQKENQTTLIGLRYKANTSFVEYLSRLEEEQKTHEDAMTTIVKQGEAKRKKIEQSFQESQQRATAEYYGNIENEIDNAISSISNNINKSTKYDSWGFVNFSSARKQLKEFDTKVKMVASNITIYTDLIKEAFDNKKINAEQYDALIAKLSTLSIQLGDVANSIPTKQQQIIDDLVGSITRYVQTALQGFQQIMDAFDQYEDYKFDKEQDALDKENEMLEKQLDKQRNIIEEHKNAVESIEDELANSRGDRRQHLIDQLNAEIAAQRAAEKERQQIEKQQEAAEKKQEALDKKRKQAEYERNLRSILISTAMATANGLATQPFVPVGIAMGALATSLGMVQYALAKKQKPYRVGGQLEGGLVTGKRHTQGGVPVGNTGIEVEGSEYIIRRESTTPNLNLLDFINKSQKKLDLSDFVEFYSDKPRKVIKNINKKMYADGGYLPTLPNSIDVREQLQNVVINQDNRPIYVSVVDINNKQEDVRRVQTLAGL